MSKLHLARRHARPFPIAIVGNINLDIKPSRITASAEIFSDGETSVEECDESVGGGGANTAIAAALMGAEVHFYGCVGNDELGRRLVSHMRSIGVVTHVATMSVSTGRSIALSWSNNQRHFISSLPNNSCLNLAAVDLKSLVQAKCRHLYRADIWFSEDMLFGGNEDLLHAAQAKGIETSIDINWDPLWNRGALDKEVKRRTEAIMKTLRYVTYVHGNERELMFFSGKETIQEAALSLTRSGAQTVIVHRGARGCAAFHEGRWIDVPASPVSQIASEIGSGDVFTAAFITHSDLAMTERLSWAARIAAKHLSGECCYFPRL